MLTAQAYDHGGDLQSARKRYGRASFLDFSANINPLGPPPAVLKMLARSRERISAYPEPRSRTLRKMLAEKHGVSPARVIVGNGAAEVLYLLAKAAACKKAHILAPTFSEYAHSQHAAGGKVHYQYLKPADNFSLPHELDLQQNTGLIFLCNPNNPTGSFFPKNSLQPLIEHVQEQGVLLLMDHSFSEFLEPEPRRMLWEPSHGRNEENVFFLYSLTKFYALPGLRLGYGIGPSSLVKKMEALRDPWTVNALAQQAGLLSLTSRFYGKRVPGLLSDWKQKFYRRLSSLPGVTLFPSAANFLLGRLPEEGPPAFFFRDQLAQKGFLMRDAGNFPGLDPFYFRLAVRFPRENAQLAAHLEELVERFC